MIEVSDKDMDAVIRNLVNPVSGITGETNTGKSTSVLYNLYQKNPNCIIFSVQRSSITVDLLVDFMNNFITTKDDLGFVSGKKYNFVNRKLKHILDIVAEQKISPKQKRLTIERGGKSSIGKIGTIIAAGKFGEEEVEVNDTQIVYVTADYFKTVMLDLIDYINICKEKEEVIPNLDFCQILALDECNVGALNYDIIMTAWTDIINMSISVPRLLLISATLDINATIFAGAPVHEIKNRKFPISIEYHNKDFLIGSLEMLDALVEVIYTKNLINPVRKYNNDIGETYMVIVSGAKAVKYVAEKLGKRGISSVTLYGGNKNNNNVISEEVREGKRRILITTNIAEYSITLRNVVGVFDSMNEKILVTSGNDRSELITTYISKSSAIQRAGRTGRTNVGFAYRMCTMRTFDGFSESAINEIIRVSINKTILEIISVKRSPKIMLKSIIDRFPILGYKIDESVKLLTSLNLIEYDNKERRLRITYEGEFCSKLNLSIRSSKFLMLWLERHENIPGIGIILTCILENYNSSYFIYETPKEKLSYNEYSNYMDEYYEINFSKFESESKTNLAATLSMWKEYFKIFEKNPLTVSKEELNNYASYTSVNINMINSVLKDIINVAEILSEEGYAIEFGGFNVENALKLIVPILREVYFDFIFIKQSTKKNGEIVYKLSSYDSELYYIIPDKNIITKNVQYDDIIIGLRTIKSKDSDGNVKNIIKIESPYDYHKIEEVIEIKEENVPVRNNRRNEKIKLEESKSNDLYQFEENIDDNSDKLNLESLDEFNEFD